jgi:hypothetical protein
MVPVAISTSSFLAPKSNQKMCVGLKHSPLVHLKPSPCCIKVQLFPWESLKSTLPNGAYPAGLMSSVFKLLGNC